MENPLVASVEVTARLAALTDATQRIFFVSVCTGWSNAWKQRLEATSTTDPKQQQPSRVDNNNGSATVRDGSAATATTVSYNSGFGNHFSTEALPGALPAGQNNPQRCPYGLYAEQISGTAFTAPRTRNRRTWCYRIRPSVTHQPCQSVGANPFENEFSSMTNNPSQMRWSPLPIPSRQQKTRVDFIEGISTMGGVGDPAAKSGLGIYVYAMNSDMGDKAFYNADGEMLLVPQQGSLRVITEMGILLVVPNEILVIPQGVKFSVDLGIGESGARGYMLETFEGHFVLPELGPIGANGLANPRDFESPVAWYEDRDVPFTVLTKFGGKLFSSAMDHSPFDVVAWHGNMAPYKYDLRKFICINSVSRDHPDPSIFTVLTCPSAGTPGVAVVDFVVFPPRWMVAEGTFRPPWYHRNTMTEFMGMVWGKYDAKEGFLPGGCSLHPSMSAHGPDAATFIRASDEKVSRDALGQNSEIMLARHARLLSPLCDTTIRTTICATAVTHQFKECM